MDEGIDVGSNDLLGKMTMWRFLCVSVVSVSLISASALPALAEEVAGGYEVEKRKGDVTVLKGDFPGRMEVTEIPPTDYELPEGELKMTPSILPAGLPEREVTFVVQLDRAVPGAKLLVKLPDRWFERSPTTGLREVGFPELTDDAGGDAAISRSQGTVELTFDDAERRDTASFVIQNIGISAGTYDLPLTWELADGARVPAGTARVRIQVVEREADEDGLLNKLAAAGRLASPGQEVNVSNSPATESETFSVVQPNNRNRVAMGSNSSAGEMPLWISNDGGATWTGQVVSTTMDVPGQASHTTASICCDPMFAADPNGNIWYGGLTSGSGSRIFVSRVPAGSNTLNSVTTGLPRRVSGTQDKPLMTIDNSSASPAFGRLYVVWDEPAGGAVRIVMSQCDTVQGGSTAADCDNSDNWSTPVTVSDTADSYIYPDVAVGPDGDVYVTYWEYNAGTNGIVGVACEPAAEDCTITASWSFEETIATLDSTGSVPVPFACPTLAQPGGRAAPQPNVEVDRSGGANNNRVYVAWNDLRPGSGSTKCSDATPPSSTQLSWDSFVASATPSGGYFPGGGASASVGTRLITDGESGGANPADDWFPWIAVDQSTGQAWADVYSTRDDSSRRTTHFYVRTVTPSGGGHSLGGLTRISTSASNYSNETCCDFGNQYGDYTGIDAAQGVAYPIWSDKRSSQGEVFTFGATPVTSSPPATPADTTPPSLTVSLGKKAKLKQLVKGLRFNVTTDEDADVLAKLKTKKSVAKKLRIAAAKTVKIGSASESVLANDKTSMRIKLTSKARRRLRVLMRRRVTPFRATLTVTATDSADNEASAEKSTRVSR